jgi:hypothetical protein
MNINSNGIYPIAMIMNNNLALAKTTITASNFICKPFLIFLNNIILAKAN